MITEISTDYLRYLSFIESIPFLITQREGDMLCLGRNEIWRLEYKKHSFVVKKYKQYNSEQQVMYTFFRSTKTFRAFRNAAEFRTRGVSTPHEIACIEILENGLYTTSYFISEEARGHEVSKDIFWGGGYDEKLADEVTRQILYMHGKGVLHGDLNLSNIFYEHQTDGNCTFDIIDINRSLFTEGWPDDMQCLRNMVRLTYNRSLYEYIVRHYAKLRGWDTENTVQKAFFLQNQFIKRRLK